MSKDERLKVGERRVKIKLKTSCQDLRPGVVQLTNCFLERINGWQAHHPLWESITLDNCQGIKGILVVICRGVDLTKRHRVVIFGHAGVRLDIFRHRYCH